VQLDQQVLLPDKCDNLAPCAGAAERQKRADDKHNTDWQLGEQLRAKAKRQAAEAARDQAELDAVLAAQAAEAERVAALESKAAAERKALSDSIKAYNEFAALSLPPLLIMTSSTSRSLYCLL
jgi:hypothetical protein